VKLSQVDMEATTRAAIAALPTSEGKRKITFKIAGLPQAYGDPAMVGQVLVNLLSNAVKFTARRRQTRIEIGCLPASRPVVYYVKDNGIGFNMEHYSKLFGVFQRLHSGADFAGTGIGLAIVQRIIQRHGGRIWAEAEVDAGATFYFTLAGA
jgi:two-component system sensor kinase